MNNNLVEWFKKGSDVRVADTVMNKALGGTSLGYIVAISDKDDYIKTPVFGDGRPWSQFGQFSKDDNVYTQVRYEF